jgi:ABC-2 type transport system permease protein
MRAAWLIARKDLLLRLRDRSALVVGVVVPLVLAFIFNAVFGGAFEGDSGLTLAYADEDGGEVAAGLVEVLEGIAGTGAISVVAAGSEADLRTLVDEGEVSAGILAPGGLSEAALAGESAGLTVIGNVDAPTGTSVAEAIATGFASGVEDTQRAVAAIVTGGDDGFLVPEVIEAAAGAESPITLGPVTAADRILDPATFFAASMAVFFLFFLVQFGVTGLLDEEREGTLTRLQAAPIPRWAVIAGKALTGFLLGMMSLSVLAVTTSLLMGAEWGNPLGVLVLFIAVTLAATSLLGIVGAVARTPEGAGNLVSVIAVALGMLGGTFFPIAGGNRVLEMLSLATPHSWFLRGVGELNAGGGLAAILPSVAVLAAFAAVGASVSVLLFAWRSE